MKTQTAIKTLYSLWLPIVNFQDFKKNIDKKYILENHKNSNWSWVIVRYSDSTITIDSLGYVYIEMDELEQEIKDNPYILQFIANSLDNETKIIINETLLNKKIGYVDENLRMDIFLQSILIKINPISENINIEYIKSTLLSEGEEIYDTDDIKFSLIKNEKNFHTILNRNFSQLLKKSIYFTHGLEFDNGEIYKLSIIENCDKAIKNFSELKDKFEIDIKNIEFNKDELFAKIIKKALQDTIEERIILHFLEITERDYLGLIIDKISKTNDILKKLNSYLLEDIDKNTMKHQKKNEELEDEWNIEIFIQNLLQTIPKFHMIESKLKEAYYIKVGNTTTNIRVGQNEMITSTLFYDKWKSSINYFIDTAQNAKESLNMYHQNKTLKELEDISYNANYQADIEDIRELQKRKDISLDDNSKQILLFLAVVALAGEAPLIQLDKSFLLNLSEIISNSLIYFLLLYYIIMPLITNWSRCMKIIKKNFTCIANSTQTVVDETLIHPYEESDYDKHEHRSNKHLYSFDMEKNRYIKISMSYNDTLSAYQLVKELKALRLTKKIKETYIEFKLFPQILENPPLLNEKGEYVYRENYRISRNDKVTTKIMFRYKVNNLKLNRFIEFIREDEFKEYYSEYLKKENIDSKKFIGINKSIKQLESGDKQIFQEIKLTFYIVYSFVLKLNYINGNNYDYSVTKDQFRVHYHINKLDYVDLKNLEDKQEALANLIYIYFLARLKKFDL